jgi:ABC-type phosphate transport system substrate-binding protein
MKRLLMLMLLISAGALDAHAQLAIIAHKAVPADTLTQAQLLDCYTGDVKSWTDKIPVVVFDLKSQSETKESFYKLLGLTSSRMKSIWLKKLLLGEGDAPEALKSEDEVVKRVAATAGAIGYVSRSRVNSDVKILWIVEKEKP